MAKNTTLDPVTELQVTNPITFWTFSNQNMANKKDQFLNQVAANASRGQHMLLRMTDLARRLLSVPELNAAIKSSAYPNIAPHNLVALAEPGFLKIICAAANQLAYRFLCRRTLLQHKHSLITNIAQHHVSGVSCKLSGSLPPPFCQPTARPRFHKPVPQHKHPLNTNIAPHVFSNLSLVFSASVAPLCDQQTYRFPLQEAALITSIRSTQPSRSVALPG